MLIQVTDLITGEYQDILKTFSDNLNFGIKHSREQIEDGVQLTKILDSGVE